MRKLLLGLTVFLFFAGTLLAQKTITGKVTDDKGTPIPNASVVVKGTAVGTTTSATGNYSLTVPANATTLVFSSVNMSEQEVAIGTNSVINAQLTLLVQDIGEVVVTVPYGTIKKTAFTGSENTINASTIQKQQVTSVTNILEGLVPGIIATNGGGQPGTNQASIRIRGIGSVSSNSAPLYVVNGAVYDGDISSISTDDVESVTVLKDAAAAALYGSRAANGVIMITTKQGKKGRPASTVTMRQGYMTRGIPEYDLVGIQDYYELFWEAYRNSYLQGGDNMTVAGQKASNVLAGPNGLVYNAYNVPAAQVVDPTTGKLNPNAKLLWNESWADALFRTASRTNANFNISGANDNTNYYLSAGYLNEDGIMRFSGYKRYSLRLDLRTQVTSWLNTGLTVDGALSKRKDVPSGGTATTNPFYYSRQMGPIYPVYQHDLTTGAFVFDPATGKNALDWGVPTQMGTRPYAGRSNLLGSLDLDDRSADIFNGNANAFAEIKFLQNFSFKATLGLNYYSSHNTNYQNNQYGDAAPSAPGATDGGRSTKTDDKQLSLTGNEVLTWSKSFGNHNIKALAGHENYKYKYNYLSANSSGFTFPGQTELDNGTGPFSPASSYQIDHRIESYFANVNYDFDGKYLLSGNYRTDGSSRFRDEVRWGDFYSVGAGWRISEEKFLKNVNWINELKLKASYGEQGNEDIGLYYPYRAYFYANGNGTYTPPSRPVSPDILWEANSILNIGFDFSFFRNRFQGTIEWFNKQSDNLLFDVPLPPSNGLTSVWQNIGTMKNYGIEAQLGYTAIRGKNFNWRIDLNLTHFKNEITKLPEIQRKNGIVSGTKKLMEGHDIFDFWLKEYAGVDAATGDALYYYDVLGTDGKPTGERKLTNVWNNATYYYHNASALPDISGGLVNSFNYKNFDLSFLLTFAYGGYFYDGNLQGIMHRGSPGTSWSTDILKRWQKPGDVTNVPRLQNGLSGQDGASTRWLVDGSYLNIKNITLSYTLPKALANRLHLSGAQIFANVDNAWLFTAKKGMDPQRVFTGTADATYTPFRTINFGFSVNLQ